GSPRIDDAHFPPAPAGALERQPRAKSAAEAEFLTLGDGARLWLTEAAAAGTTKMRIKMAEAVSLAKLFGSAEVDWALGHAAVHARFAEADLPSILNHHATAGGSATHRAGEDRSLTQGTAGWAALGQRPSTADQVGTDGQEVTS
ncbi:IS21 family transposase, partial [Sediminivirga luteola]|nr:IS21 family transposase [Sediminivirga luteola]